jgi:hypothetical protein
MILSTNSPFNFQMRSECDLFQQNRAEIGRDNACDDDSIDAARMCVGDFVPNIGSAAPHAAEHRSDNSDKQPARSRTENFDLVPPRPVRHLFHESSSDDASNDIEVGEGDTNCDTNCDIDADDDNPVDDVIVSNEIPPGNVNFVRQWMTHADAAPVQLAYCATSNNSEGLSGEHFF